MIQNRTLRMWKRKSHISSKLHMIYRSSRPLVTKTISISPTTLLVSLHYLLFYSSVNISPQLELARYIHIYVTFILDTSELFITIPFFTFTQWCKWRLRYNACHFAHHDKYMFVRNVGIHLPSEAASHPRSCGIKNLLKKTGLTKIIPFR